MSKNRGLYGQTEGNESRSTTAVFEERLLDNQLVEGDWMKAMVEAAKKGNMKEMARLRDSMINNYVSQGVARVLAQGRADSVLSQALFHLKV